ncbi:hypothetical protein J8273_2058 [Carpediemonas membranifera]|uniref:Uncharacterized protein n=1 Tax=Carpediemonas membranifera TaxID=201153 RepID=A0A8J6BFE7_9EUKA|nr:hypothetical protein J8273_2058 [Carpediemonas membranifera]|eukprot:KAG9396327.1 hypothetical protein J8273_2058 [Carpediemonas membranifera]
MHANLFTIFVCGRQLLFAGKVHKQLAQSGLLPGFNTGSYCLKPAPLRFPERIKGLFASNDNLIWVTEDQTRLVSEMYGEPTVILFEVSAFTGIFFRDSSGQWFGVSRVSGGVAVMKMCKTPKTRAIAIPSVNVDPTTD